MKDTVLARRYARALFDLAVERDILDKICSELLSFEHSLQTHAGMRSFLYSQNVSKMEKASKLEAVLQDSVSNVFVNFLHVLLRKNRESIFTTVAHEFMRMVDDHQKKTRATTITAVPLDKQALAKLKSVLDKAFGKDVQIDNRVDASVLGGIVVSVDGQLLDGSLSSQLRRLEGQLMGSSNSKH